jgi:hypothetical protein
MRRFRWSMKKTVGAVGVLTLAGLAIAVTVGAGSPRGTATYEVTPRT